MGAQATLIGSLIGGGLMYLLDPEAGGRRRAQVRDAAVRLRRQAREAQDTTVRDLKNRLRGVKAGVASAVTRDVEPATDETVQQRVRAALGSLVRYPRLVDVDVRNGHVELTGSVAADEVRRLLRRLASVPGAASVEHRLDVHDSPASLPGAQAPIPERPSAPAIALLRENWPPAVRLAAGVAGAGLFLGGNRRATPAGVGLALVGAGVLARSVTNQPLLGRRNRPTRGAGHPGAAEEPGSTRSR